MTRSIVLEAADAHSASITDADFESTSSPANSSSDDQSYAWLVNIHPEQIG